MNLSLSTPSSSIEQSSTLCKTWCRGIVAVTCWSMMSNGSGGTHHVGRWRKVQLPQLGPPTCLQIPEPSSPLPSIEASCLWCSVCTLHIACNGKTEPFFRGKKRTELVYFLFWYLFFFSPFEVSCFHFPPEPHSCAPRLFRPTIWEDNPMLIKFELNLKVK